jgi:ApaG protein
MSRETLPGCRGSDVTTQGFRVQVRPAYLPEQSGEGEAWKGRRYVFSYTIRVTNQSNRGAKLLSRQWIIVDADGERHEVRGEGVVGRQPDIAPGQEFEYSSYCPLQTPWGTMEGSYSMRGDGGEEFQIAIGRFYLVAPE